MKDSLGYITRLYLFTYHHSQCITIYNAKGYQTVFG